MQGKTLDTLHFDLLDLIIHELHSPFMHNWDDRWMAWPERPPSMGLLPLSSVCRHLRKGTLPWIFRDIRFSVMRLGQFLPRNLWCHVRTFRLDDFPPEDTVKEELDLVRKETYELLSQMDQVTTVYLGTYILPQALVLALTSLPRLSSLVFCGIPTEFDDNLVFHQFCHLQELIHITPTFREPIHWGSDKAKVIGEYLFETACVSSSMLVHLDILAQFVPFERMASIPWSSLQTLILRGHIYSKEANLFSTVLAVAPKLSELVMDLIIVGASTSQFAVYLNDSKSPSSDNPLIRVPKLQRLTLANAHPADHIFHHLSSEMVFLSLPAVTLRKGQMQRSELALSSNATSSILRRCTASNITEFRISISGELPPTLLTEVSEAFPSLEKFELRHRVDVDEHGYPIGVTEYSPDAYASAFSTFLHLRHLNLDWPLTNVADADDYPWGGSTDSPRIAMELFAILVARNVQSLASIGFAECTVRLSGRLPWQVFVIERTGIDSCLTAYQVDNHKPEIPAFQRISVTWLRSTPNDYPYDPTMVRTILTVTDVET